MKSQFFLKFGFTNNHDHFHEILALSALIIATVFFTSYYNYTKEKINKNYKEIINNIYFKKTANHFLNNLEPKFKKIRHQISDGETFDSILIVIYGSLLSYFASTMRQFLMCLIIRELIREGPTTKSSF